MIILATLTAKDLVKLAWNGQHTWSEDRTIKVGKLSKNVAYELVKQPSHDFKPYKVSKATYDPAAGIVKGEYLDNFETLELAMKYIEQLKRTGDDQ